MEFHVPGSLIVRLQRSGVVEAEHVCDAALVSAAGEINLVCGDPQCQTPLLGVSHPLFVVTLLESPSALELDGPEMAIMAGKNQGDEPQRQAIRSLFIRSSLGEESLQLGPEGPRHACAGFHAGLLVAAKKLEVQSSYRNPDSPLQKMLIDGLLRMIRKLRTEVPVVTDDCGVVSPCLPLCDIASLYAALADHSTLSASAGTAASKLVSAIRANPGSFAAEGSFERDLLDASDQDVIIRCSENGLCAAALCHRGLGLAVKAQTGSTLQARRAFLALLAHLQVIPRGRTSAILDAMRVRRNGRGDHVGDALVEVSPRR